MFGGTYYSLPVTDATYERRFLARRDGVYDISECCLSVSLGEAYGGFVYKLIAAVGERLQTESR